MAMGMGMGKGNKGNNLGDDLRIYYMNIKSKKGWINCKDKL